MKKSLIILRVDPEALEGKLRDFVESIKPPFVFEVAAHLLGRGANYYIILSKRRAKTLIDKKGVEEAEDYHLFHHGGEHTGFYAKGKGGWADLDLAEINLEKVGEIGEGAVVQMVFGRKGRRGTPVNLRILVSAPSSFRVKRIMTTLRPAFQKFSLIESRKEDFINKVNLRELTQKETMYWNLAPQPAKE